MPESLAQTKYVEMKVGRLIQVFCEALPNRALRDHFNARPYHEQVDIVIRFAIGALHNEDKNVLYDYLLT